MFKSNLLNHIITNGRKNKQQQQKKKQCSSILTLLLRSVTLVMGPFVTIFLEYNLAARLHFSEIVSIGKLDDLKKDFVSLKMIGMEIGKRQFSTYLNNVC